MRRATCQCGQLVAECEGEPVRVSVCHCLNCQQRSGSAFAAQARFPAEKVKLTGEAKQWVRNNESGSTAEFHFCPRCGSGVYYRLSLDPDLIAVAVGAFADPTFPPPHYSVYEERKHAWLEITGEGIEHYG